MIDLRPRKLDAYIVRKFISTFFIALILIIGIVIIFEMSEKIEDFLPDDCYTVAIEKTGEETREITISR